MRRAGSTETKRPRRNKRDYHRQWAQDNAPKLAKQYQDRKTASVHEIVNCYLKELSSEETPTEYRESVVIQAVKHRRSEALEYDRGWQSRNPDRVRQKNNRAHMKQRGRLGEESA